MRILGFVIMAMGLCACSNDTPDAPPLSAPVEALITPAEPEPLHMIKLDCGLMEVSDLDLFSEAGDLAGQSGDLAVTCWLVRHPEGDLIWELGLPSVLAGQPPMESSPYTLSLDETITSQLRQLGLTPSDIEYVSISTSQFAHVGQVDQFGQATWLVNGAEFAAMFPPTPEGEEEPENSTHAEFLNLNRQVFEGDIDVFADGSVLIKSAPGPTVGHSVLQVRLPDRGPVLLTGALFHSVESRTTQRIPRFNSDAEATRNSIGHIEEHAADLQAKVIIPFDLDTVESLPARLN